MTEENKKPTVVINVGGEMRSFPLETLSEEANRSVASIQYYKNNIQPFLGEVIRLIQIGAAVDSDKLVSLLPKGGYEVLKEAVEEAVVEETLTEEPTKES
jgi:hypothetical protein|tara:strand:- start:62 stop:361 length:300 start_codon:yes stop_codon:yes gene_type:complete